MKLSKNLKYIVIVPAAVAALGFATKSILSESAKPVESRAVEYIEALPVKQDTLYGPSLDALIYKNIPDKLISGYVLYAARDRITELNKDKFPKGGRSPTYNIEILNVPYDPKMNSK